MDWLFLAQQGQQAPAPGGGLGTMLIPLVLMLVAMYFMVIKPQKRKQQEHEERIKRTKAGDHVVTVGGLHGTIVGVNDKTFMVKLADKIVVEISRSHVAHNLRTEGDTDEAEDKDTEKGSS